MCVSKCPRTQRSRSERPGKPHAYSARRTTDANREVQMRLLRGVLGAAAVVVLVLGVTACGGYGGDDNGGEGGSTTIGGMSAGLHGPEGGSGEGGETESERWHDYCARTVI